MIGYNNIEDRGAKAIIQSLHKIKYLSVRRCGISPEGVKQMRNKAPWIKPVKTEAF